MDKTVARMYLDGGKALDTLLCAQLLVLLVVTVDIVKWNQGVETESGLAELGCHLLAVLWQVVSVRRVPVRWMCLG